MAEELPRRGCVPFAAVPRLPARGGDQKPCPERQVVTVCQGFVEEADLSAAVHTHLLNYSS